jgi:heptaprenyl diphosphate synthase
MATRHRASERPGESAAAAPLSYRAWLSGSVTAMADRLAELATPAPSWGDGSDAGMAVLVSAGFGDGSAPAVLEAAVTMGLVESGCRFHDEVRDEPGSSGDLNRERILWGDLLLARALLVAADVGPAVVRIVARTVASVQEQAVAARRPGACASIGASAAARRTGLLWAGAAELGCAQADVVPGVVNVLTRTLRCAAAGRNVDGMLARLPASVAADGLADFVRHRLPGRRPSPSQSAGGGQPRGQGDGGAGQRAQSAF